MNITRNKKQKIGKNKRNTIKRSSKKNITLKRRKKNNKTNKKRVVTRGGNNWNPLKKKTNLEKKIYKAINKAYRCYVDYKSTNNKDYLEQGCRYLTVIYNKTRYEKKFFSDNYLFTNKNTYNDPSTKDNQVNCPIDNEGNNPKTKDNQDQCDKIQFIKNVKEYGEYVGDGEKYKSLLGFVQGMNAYMNDLWSKPVEKGPDIKHPIDSIIGIILTMYIEYNSNHWSEEDLKAKITERIVEFLNEMGLEEVRTVMNMYKKLNKSHKTGEIHDFLFNMKTKTKSDLDKYIIGPEKEYSTTKVDPLRKQINRSLAQAISDSVIYAIVTWVLKIKNINGSKYTYEDLEQLENLNNYYPNNYK